MATPGTLTPAVDHNAAVVPGQFSAEWWITANRIKKGFVPPAATTTTVAHYGTVVHDYT